MTGAGSNGRTSISRRARSSACRPRRRSPKGRSASAPLRRSDAVVHEIAGPAATERAGEAADHRNLAIGVEDLAGALGTFDVAPAKRDLLHFHAVAVRLAA